MQLVTKHWADARILTAAHAYEQATEWHKRIPEL
jgi:Asp-tRNA(Asn)/Glu-tRNA(Gln) amidotransferase A subunit family amidase